MYLSLSIYINFAFIGPEFSLILHYERYLAASFSDGEDIYLTPMESKRFLCSYKATLNRRLHLIPLL